MALFTPEQEAAISAHPIRTKSGWPVLKRGWQALRGDYSPAYGPAPKTWSFVDNIEKHSTSLAVTVDSHAIMAWLGCNDKGGTYAFAASIYQQAAADYTAVADELGILPLQLQAIVWIVRKRILAEQTGSHSWMDAWIECKYGSTWIAPIKGAKGCYMQTPTHPHYMTDSNSMESYALDVDVCLEYGGQHNLWHVYNLATKEEIVEGMSWYRIAHEECQAVANRHGLPLRYIVEAVSAVSPGREWSGNVKCIDILATISRDWTPDW